MQGKHIIMNGMVSTSADYPNSITSIIPIRAHLKEILIDAIGGSADVGIYIDDGVNGSALVFEDKTQPAGLAAYTAKDIRENAWDGELWLDSQVHYEKGAKITISVSGTSTAAFSLILTEG